jgi:hypothetical protein
MRVTRLGLCGLLSLIPAVTHAGPPTPPIAVPPLVLEAVVTTSGPSGDVLLDGDPKTSWSPVGDPVGEGVLFRFDGKVSIDAIEAQGCAADSDFAVDPVVDTADAQLLTEIKGAKPVQRDIRFNQIHSVFLKITNATKNPCLSEVAFYKGGKKLDVIQPKAVTGKVAASSTLDPIDAYHPAYLFDGRTDFAWVEGAKGLGIGEAVTLELDAPLEVTALEIWNGYQRSEAHFKKNARLKELSLSVDGAAPMSLAVKDQMGAQKLALPKPVSGKIFKFGIGSGYEGTRYPDLVVSEIRLWTANGPVSIKLPERVSAFQQQISGKALGAFADKQWATLCESNPTQVKLKLRTNHTFVSYEESGGGSVAKGNEDVAGVHSVFEGAWVVRGQASPWSEVEFFGRRDAVVNVWVPYGQDEKPQPPGVDGGKLKVARVADLKPADLKALFDKWKTGEASGVVECLKPTKPDGSDIYDSLKTKNAFIVQGALLTDVLVPVP